MRYRFTPNGFAKSRYILDGTSYDGDGMTPLLESVLGDDNYRRDVVAQDPLCDGKTFGIIDIRLGTTFVPIGSIEVL
jgi:hypothetical protein